MWETEEGIIKQKRQTPGQDVLNIFGVTRSVGEVQEISVELYDTKVRQRVSGWLEVELYR